MQKLYKNIVLDLAQHNMVSAQTLQKRRDVIQAQLQHLNDDDIEFHFLTMEDDAITSELEREAESGQLQTEYLDVSASE